MAGRIMLLKDVHVPATGANVATHKKGELKLQMELRLLVS